MLMEQVGFKLLIKRNRLFYNLIQSFYKISDVPIILNTSFNENEPIVNKPEEAIECFKEQKWIYCQLATL